MPDATRTVPLEFLLNGQAAVLEVFPGETLLQVLRRLGCHSVKHGCETGDCGACAVLVDGITHNACVMFAMQARGRSITTLEGLGSPDGLHPLQEAFVEFGAIQCGYCTPGMILSSLELLRRNVDPTPDDVKDALSGNLCRCTGYHKPVRAVLAAVRKMHESETSPPPAPRTISS